MIDIESYAEMIKLSPKIVSPATLLELPDAKYRVYTYIKAEQIYERSDSIIILGDGFKCKIQGVSLHILEGDTLWFRNFYKRGNNIYVTGELMIERKPMRIRISNGVIPIIKGKLITDGETLKLRTKKREINLKVDDKWVEILNRYINREIIIKNALYDSNTLFINYDTEVYMEK